MTDGEPGGDRLRRRHLLKAAASVSAATTLAGCRTNFDETATPTDGATATTTTAAGTETATEEPTTTVTLEGDRAGVEPCQGPEDPAPGPECNAPETIDSDVVTDTTLGEDCNQYVVEETLGVNSGATLTVRPGTVLRFDEGASLVVEADGSLVADGTCGDPVTFSGTASQRGHWGGIVLDGAGGNLLSYCIVEYAGSDATPVGPARAGIEAGGGASLSLSNSTVRGHDGYGLALGGDVTVSRLEKNAFVENTDGAAVATPRSVRALSEDNLYVGNDEDVVHVDPGDPIPAGASHTWEHLLVPYRIAGDLRVEGELTVRPGNTLLFEEGTGVHVGGRLFAIGTPGDEISFTATVRERGHWRGIAVLGSDGSRGSLANCTVEYAGRGTVAGTGRAAAVGVGSGARCTMENCTLRRSDGYGLVVGDGGRVDGFTGNALSANRAGAAAVPSPVVPELTTDNTYSGNAEDVVDVSVTGPISRGERRRWAGIDATYRVDDGLRVLGTLVLDAGTSLAFAPRAALVVEEGTLEAVGAADDRITFTGANKQPGIWQGIHLQDSESELRHCLVEFGGGERFSGGNRPANVTVTGGASASIDDCLVRGSDAYGIAIGRDATLASFEGNEVTANGAGAGIVELPVARELTGESTYRGNETDVIDVLTDGEIPAGTEHVWNALGVPYRVRGDVVVEGRLELSPGTNLRMTGDTGLQVRSDGTFDAAGTENRRITIAGTRERRGHWDGINFQSSAKGDNRLHHCRVLHGGGTKFVHARVPANISLTLSSYASVRNCAIESSAGVGLHATSDSTLQAADNSYRSNEMGATDIS